MEGYVLIVEVTTRHARSHLVNNMGRIAFSSERMLKATTRFAERPYIVELDPVYVWNSICECINDCARWAGPEKVKCVAATSQRFATTIIDRKGETKAMCPNVDARGVEVSDVLSGHMGDEAFKVTGHYPPFLFSAYRLMWFREFQPEALADPMYVASMDGWLSHKMTGSPAEEPSQASGTFLFDVSKRRWSEEICELIGVEPEWLPRLVDYGGLIGYLTDELQSLTGIGSRTPVVMGAGDTQCSGIGSFALSAGQVYISMGSTAPIHVIMSSPLTDKAKRMWTGCFPIDGQWVLESNMGMCGVVYEWLASSVLRATKGGDVDHDLFEGLASSAPACSRDVLAFLGLSVMDAKAFTNITPPAIVLPSLLIGEKPGAADIARACYEDMAYACRGNIEQMEEVYPDVEPHVRVAGGLAKSNLMLQILADVLKRRVLVPFERHASVIGCAAAALSFLESRSPKQVVKDLAELNEIEPSEDLMLYDSSYRRWRLIYDKLSSLM